MLAPFSFFILFYISHALACSCNSHVFYFIITITPNYFSVSDFVINGSCPVNIISIFIINDRFINVLLTEQLCIQCRFIDSQNNSNFQKCFFHRKCCYMFVCNCKQKKQTSSASIQRYSGSVSISRC